MRPLFLFGLMMSLLLSFSFPGKASAPEDWVRVRLLKDLKKVEIYGIDLQVRERNLKSILRAKPVAVPRMIFEKITVEPVTLQGKKFFKVSERDRGINKVKIIAGPFLEMQGDQLLLAGLAVPSRVLLQLRQGRVDVIGALPLEEYLAGVLTSEMPSSWPLEALKAQAVAARSYTLAVMHERADQPFHVESTVHDQVFKHKSRPRRELPKYRQAERALRETQGIFLQEKSSQQTVKSFYHSDCGGITRSAKSVWGSGSQQGAVVDQSCPQNPKARWSLTLSQRDLSQKMRKLIPNGGLIKSISPTFLEKGEEKVILGLASGEKKSVRANDLRATLGFDRLKSTRFQVQTLNEGFVFQGLGFGHGVGLCQWGARALASRGLSYLQILSHYYSFAALSSPSQNVAIRLESRQNTKSEENYN
ncbi:MAG: SpoIID/LytB domain-containing protein [Pseudobdellovibrionaceae bacterium]